jgi:hypothetical protein
LVAKNGGAAVKAETVRIARAGLRSNRRVGDKTGSGGHGTVNDADAQAARGLSSGLHPAKQYRIGAVPTGTLRANGAFYYRLPSGRKPMQDRFKFKSAPETLSLFAIILVMIVFGAGIVYEGVSFKGSQKTTQVAGAGWNP